MPIDNDDEGHGNKEQYPRTVAGPVSEAAIGARQGVAKGNEARRLASITVALRYPASGSPTRPLTLVRTGAYRQIGNIET